MPRATPAPIVRTVLADELRHRFDITATLQAGLTGLGGDIEFSHTRRDAEISTITILTLHADAVFGPMSRFSEGATCVRRERAHECVLAPENRYPKSAARWKYHARYRASDTSTHQAAAHVSHDARANTEFDVTVSYRVDSQKYDDCSWFAPARYDTTLSL